jgi:hypothetical protein
MVGGPPRTCTWDLIPIRKLHPGLFLQDRTCDLGERRTAGDGWGPLGSDGMGTKRGPPSAAEPTRRSASVQRGNGLVGSAEGRVAGPEPPTTAPTGTIGAWVFHRLHETAACDKPVRVVPVERFPVRDPAVDHWEVLRGCAAWAQPARQAGGPGLRGGTVEPPAQRRHAVSLAGPPEAEEVGSEAASTPRHRPRSWREGAATCGFFAPVVLACARRASDSRGGTDPSRTGDLVGAAANPRAIGEMTSPIGLDYGTTVIPAPEPGTRSGRGYRA